MIDYTLVVGVDAYHLRQLAVTWPTWMRHKPSLRQHPMIVFRDTSDVSHQDVLNAIDHPNLKVTPWPIQDNISYRSFSRFKSGKEVPAVVPGSGWDNGDILTANILEPVINKWNDPQRYKMLAGFVHVPAMFVETTHWLKVDCDVVASGQDDWIKPEWFEGNPAMVAHAWTFTKPPDQMMKLDEWAESEHVKACVTWKVPPLNLVPLPGASRVGHKRIISWCGIFNAGFTRLCAGMANATCGLYKLPVQSQDGYMWYMATRLGLPVKRVSMKQVGWEQWSTWNNVCKAAYRVMKI